MNNKKLALLISKHPLLKKLTEDKTIPNNVVARLIVEELLKEDQEKMNDIKAIIDREVNDHDEDYDGIGKATQLIKELPDSYTTELKNELNAYLKQKIEDKKAGSSKNPEKQDLKTAPADDELEKDQQENPFKDLEDYSGLNLKPSEEKVFIKFMNFLKEKELLKELSLRPLFKIIGRDKGMSQFVKTLPPHEKEIWRKVFGREDVQEFLKVNLKQIEKPQEQPASEPERAEEPTKEPEASSETSGETKDPPPSEIPEEQKNEYIDASTKFQNEFYNQKYRIQQAKLIGAVIDAIEKIYDNPNQVVAFARPPQEQETVNEQQETVEPSKDELRNLRVDFRSFLSRVNKTSKALEKFEKIKDSGSMITDTYKKQFIDLLKEVQMSIKRIHRDLQIIIGKRQINEIDENSDIMKKWKEVEGKYNKAVASASALRELIDGTQTPEDPEQIIQDTYASLSDLATHFPSINPFASSGAKTREDMNKYKNSFENAVKQVKSDLQNVLALINQGQSGEDTLQLAMEGLKTFSGAIQNIFGIQSQFKDVKVEKDTPATQGETQPEKASDDTRQGEEEQTSQTLNNEERVNKVFKEFFAKNKNIFEEEETKHIKKLIAMIDKELMDNLKKYIGKGLEEINEGILDFLKTSLHKELNDKVFDSEYKKLLKNIAGENRTIEWVVTTQNELFKNALKQMPKESQEKISSLLKNKTKGQALVKKIKRYIYNMLLLGVKPGQSSAQNIYMSKYDNEDPKKETEKIDNDEEFELPDIEREEKEDLVDQILNIRNQFSDNEEAKEEVEKIIDDQEGLKNSEKEQIKDITKEKFADDTNEPDEVKGYLLNALTFADEEENDEKSSPLKKMAKDAVKEKQKADPKASKEEVINDAVETVMADPKVKKAINTALDSEEKKNKIEKEVRKNINDSDIGFTQKKIEPQKPFLDRLFEKMEQFASAEEKRTIKDIKKKNITKDSEKNKREFLIGVAASIYSFSALNAFEMGNFKLFEGPTDPDLQAFKELIFEEAADALNIEVPKILPLEQIIDFGGKKRPKFTDYTTYNTLSIPEDMQEIAKNAVVSEEDGFKIGAASVSGWSGDPRLRLTYRDIEPYTKAHGLVGLVAGLKDGIWGVQPTS